MISYKTAGGKIISVWNAELQDYLECTSLPGYKLCDSKEQWHAEQQRVTEIVEQGYEYMASIPKIEIASYVKFCPLTDSHDDSASLAAPMF